jgi:hypothetical protein
MTSSTCPARGTGDGGHSAVIIRSPPISGILLQYNALAETCLGHACDAFAQNCGSRFGGCTGVVLQELLMVTHSCKFAWCKQACRHTGELIGTAPEQLTLTFRASINKHRSLVHWSLLCIIISNKTRRVHLQNVVGILCNACVLEVCADLIISMLSSSLDRHFMTLRVLRLLHFGCVGMHVNLCTAREFVDC